MSFLRGEGRTVSFTDRIDAGRRLAALPALRRYTRDVVVLGLPRGGVPVAAEVATALGAPLDVLLVRKLGVPVQPELAFGAIGEHGVRVINESVTRYTGLSADDIEAVEARERRELQRRLSRYRAARPAVPLAGRTAIIVDDGVATGSTARAACLIARAQKAARVVLAVPVAPQGWTHLLGDVADDLVCVDTPERFAAIGQFYEDFSATTDEEVRDCLREADARAAPERAAPSPAVAPSAAADSEVVFRARGGTLTGRLTAPAGASGIVLFAHGSGSGRNSPRNRYVAQSLNRAGLATLLFDLLTQDEERDRANVFDAELLAERLDAATDWVRDRLHDPPVGYFGASTGAAAALRAAADPARPVWAIVCRGGRPDLAAPLLPEVTAPTRLIVGGRDEAVLDLNRRAQAMLRCENRLDVVPGATHLFEEPGALEKVADLAADWFTAHFAMPSAAAGGRPATARGPQRR